MAIAQPRPMNSIFLVMGVIGGSLFVWLIAGVIVFLAFVGITYLGTQIPILQDLLVALGRTFRDNPEPSTFLLATAPAIVTGILSAYLGSRKWKALVFGLPLLAVVAYGLLTFVDFARIIPESQLPSIDAVNISLVGVFSGIVGALIARWLGSDDDD